MESLVEKEIRGLNLRHVITTLVAIISFFCGAAYYAGKIEEDIQADTKLVNQILLERKEERKSLEEYHRLTDIRLTIIETQLKIKNP